MGLELVWEEDRKSCFHTSYGCESVAAVAERAAQVVIEFEQSHSNSAAILVAHGDVLQILRTVWYYF